MSLLNGLKIFSAGAAAGSATTTVTGDPISTATCEGIVFFTIIPTAAAESNFLKIQASDSPTFASGVVDITDAKAIPSDNADLVAVDVSEIPALYVRAAIVRGGAAQATQPIYAIKYGNAKLPTVNDGTYGAVTVSAENVETETPAPTIARPAITSPANEAANIALDATITSSAYAVRDGSDAHEKSQFVIAEVITVTPEEGDPYETIDWEDPTLDTEKETDLEELELAGTELENGKTYQVKVRYFTTAAGWSSYSPVIEFTTVAAG